MDLLITVITAIAAIAAALAAIGSWRAATKANEAATEIARIERGRRHAEVAPQFQICFAETANSEGYAGLRVALSDGGLDQLDQVIVTILDEAGQDHWAGGLPRDVTLEQAQAFVWGPWEFNTGASVQVVSNRESRPIKFSIVDGRNWIQLSLTRTKPGFWMTGTTSEGWRRDHPGPLRLRLTCRGEGYEPWMLLREVDVGPGGSAPA